MQTRGSISETSACWNCRFCDFSDGEAEKWCSKIQHNTMREALCCYWEKRYMTVFEFQEDFPTKEQREERLKVMSDSEIDQLIRSCGTAQGKIYYSKHKKGSRDSFE